MATPTSMHVIWRFGVYEVDTRRVEVRRAGIPVKLREQSFLILVYLLEHAGEIVSREELRQVLWPSDTFVDFEHSLSTAVMKLRDSLGDSAVAPLYIETIPKHGYRFIAPVTAGPADPEPSRTSAGEVVAIAQPAKDVARRALVMRPMLWLAAACLAGLAILVWVNAYGLRKHLLRRLLPTPRIESVAVLPLASLSGDPEQEYFADGMTDALLTDLGRIGNLRVISRQSIMQYKGSTKPLPEIARELDVDAIVEGTVQRSGDRVRITAQLVQGKTDRHLWAQSYERAFRDVLRLQGEVALDIAQEVEVRLSPEQTRSFTDARTVNPEAYEEYLKGRFQLYRISSQGFDSAESYFQRALEKDPSYARAYAGLASVWLMRADAGYESTAEMMPKAQAAVHKALQLDPNLSDAYVTLANIDALYKRQWVKAEPEFQRAIQLSPNNANAHFMYADYLITLKRDREWQVEIQRALALDPMNSFTRTFYAWQLVYLGRCDEAISILQTVLASQPGFSSAHLGLWGAYYKKHMTAQAMQEAIKFFESLHDKEVATALSAGYRNGGYREGMRRGADILAGRSQHTHVPAIRVARLYAHAGDADKTLDWLQKANDARETPLEHLSVGWDWDSLRTDPRFQRILASMNFPPPPPRQ